MSENRGDEVSQVLTFKAEDDINHQMTGTVDDCYFYVMAL